jgi:hypothetical protein
MKVDFVAFPKAFSGNVAVFVAADKQLLASAQAIDKESGEQSSGRSTPAASPAPRASRSPCWASPAASRA